MVANGAGNPCATCGMSHHNTVHTNPKQFGYHAHVARPEPPATVEDDSGLIDMELEECLEAKRQLHVRIDAETRPPFAAIEWGEVAMLKVALAAVEARVRFLVCG